jgi:hypothetical protein
MKDKQMAGHVVLDHCPYCDKLTDVNARNCTHCGWLLNRKVN